MSNDYTPRKKDEAFALPPVPPWVGRKVSLNDLIHYRHAVAAPLIARIAELEADLRISRDASKCLEADRARLRAEVEALRADAGRYRETLAIILRIHLTFAIGRYLLACTHGRWSGAEKAQRHDEMCAVYAAIAVGRHDVDELRGEHAFEALHTRVREATREITDALDDAIGFPVDDPHPDLDLLTGRFFERFHEIAMAEISLGSSAIDAARKGEGSEPPENCRQRLRAEGKAYPRSSCEACGQFSPKHAGCDALLEAKRAAQAKEGAE